MAKILLAEDVEDVALMLSEVLTREGHQVDIVYDGRALIDNIDDGKKYDVIITDLLMPKLDGYGVLRYLKAANDKTPVLVLSGGGVTLNSDDALRAVHGLAAAVMKKPVNCSELIEKIKEVV